METKLLKKDIKDLKFLEKVYYQISKKFWITNSNIKYINKWLMAFIVLIIAAGWLIGDVYQTPALMGVIIVVLAVVLKSISFFHNKDFDDLVKQEKELKTDAAEETTTVKGWNTQNIKSRFTIYKFIWLALTLTSLALNYGNFGNGEMQTIILHVALISAWFIFVTTIIAMIVEYIFFGLHKNKIFNIVFFGSVLIYTIYKYIG